MSDRAEITNRFAADFVTGTVSRIVLRMFLFQLFKLLQQIVKLKVGNLGRSINIVQPIVPAQGVSKIFNLFQDCGGHD